METLEEIREKFYLVGAISGADIEWLLEEVERLKALAEENGYE